MKRSVLLLLLTFLGYFLAAQTIFCEAKELATEQESYFELADKVAQQKKLLLKSLGKDSSNFDQPYRIFHGGKEGEAIIQNTLKFLKQPFSGLVQNPIDFTSFKNEITRELSNSYRLIPPFLDGQTNSILLATGYGENMQVRPFYFFDNEKQNFYIKNGDFIEEVPYWKVNSADNSVEQFIPTAADELTVLFNPTAGEFHLREADFFETRPVAKWSPINHKVYFTYFNSESNFDYYDFEDNSIYEEDSNVIALFINSETKETTAVFLSNQNPNYKGNENTTAGYVIGGDIATIATSRSLPSVIVDGLSQFLVERTKEELTLAFFNQFRKALSESNEFSTLLPKTNFLLQTQENLFRIPSMGVLWIESFQADIQQLIPNLEHLIITDTAYQDLKNKPTTQAFRLAYHLIDLSKKGQHPLDILRALSNEIDEDAITEYNLTSVIEVLNLLSKGLQNCETDDKKLLTVTDLRALSKIEKKYFTALLYRNNAEAIQNLLNIQDVHFLQNLLYGYDEFLSNLTQLTGILQNLNNANESYYQTAFQPKSKVEGHYAFAKIAKPALDLLEWGFKFKYLTDIKAYYQSPFYQEYYPIIVNTINAIEHVERAEYGVFLINMAQILQPIVQQKLSATSNEKFNNEGKFLKDFLFYTGFMVDILSAKNATDVGGIIQQYALPVGSFRMKRQTKFSLDVNAFPGLYMGIESGLKSSVQGDGVIGVTAPIGLAASWGDLNQAPQSFSLFFPIIDIGAAFSYRWGNQAGGFPDKLKWRQILSPGVHGVYGFKDLPISIMVGAQFLPKLRSISADGLNLETSQSVWHFGVSGVVDIPLFNLHVDENR